MRNEQQVLDQILKHNIYKLIVLALLLAFITGCQDKVQTNLAPLNGDKAEKLLIKAVKSDLVNAMGMTKLEEFSIDLDMDSTEENIELYTAAKRNAKGEMMWDDGQNWLLVVRDGDKSYPLLSGYVQLGQVYFTVSRIGPDQGHNIAVIVPTDSSFSVIGYSFDSEKKGFVRQQLYESEDDNWIYSSIPDY